MEITIKAEGDINTVDFTFSDNTMNNPNFIDLYISNTKEGYIIAISDLKAVVGAFTTNQKIIER